jgi:hypothetical protein
VQQKEQEVLAPQEVPAQEEPLQLEDALVLVEIEEEP